MKKIVSKELKEKPFNIEGLENKNWVLMDYIDVIVHIFKKDLFNFMYSLVESMALSLINFILQYLNAN